MIDLNINRKSSMVIYATQIQFLLFFSLNHFLIHFRSSSTAKVKIYLRVCYCKLYQILSIEFNLLPFLCLSSFSTERRYKNGVESFATCEESKQRFVCVFFHLLRKKNNYLMTQQNEEIYQKALKFL